MKKRDHLKKIEQLTDERALDLALTRMAHQLLEGGRDLANTGIVGMQTRGVSMARRIVAKTGDLEHAKPRSGTLDVTLYRDDYRIALKQPSVPTFPST